MEPTANLTDAAVLAAELRQILRDAKSFNISTHFNIDLSGDKLSEIIKTLDSKIAASFRELNYSEKQKINELVTIQLIQQGIMKQEMPIQPEVTPATENCPEPYKWSCYDGVATEVEVLEFLYASVRMLKPKFILETGTYLGHAAVHMALAQQKNGFGDLLTCDIDESCLQKAISLALQNDIDQNHIQFVLRQGADVIRSLDDRSLDFVFLDSGNELVRIQETELVISKLTKNGVVVVHDTNKLISLRESIDFTRREALMPACIFEQTPRGLAIFQKI